MSFKQALDDIGVILINKFKNLNATLLSFTDFMCGAAVGYVAASGSGWSGDGWFSMVFWGCLSFGIAFSIPQVAASTAVRMAKAEGKKPIAPLFNFGLLIMASQIISIYGAHGIQSLDLYKPAAMNLWLITVPGDFLGSVATLAIGILVPYTNGYLSYSKVISGVSRAGDVVTQLKQAA